MIRRVLLLCCIFVSQIFCVDTIGREQRGFVEKVTTYIQQVRNGVSGKEGVGEVLGRAVLLTPYSSMKSVATVLNHLGPFLIQDKDAATNEACCASFVKILVPIVEQFNRELFHNLHIIDHCIEYWEYQRLHPVSYFFPKAPIKYFTLGQQEEITEKIQYLKEEQQCYFVLLGKINIHLSSFDANIAIDEQYAWIQKLCMILFSYDPASAISTDVELFPLLYEATKVVDTYRKHARERLVKYRIPPFISRYWIHGISASIGLLFGGRYAYNYRSEIMDNTKSAWKTVSEMLSNQKEEFKYAFVNYRKDDGVLNQEYKELFTLFKDKIGKKRLGDNFDDLWHDLQLDTDHQNPNPRILSRMFDYFVLKVGDSFAELAAAAKECGEELEKEGGFRNLYNIGGVKGKVGKLLEALGSSNLSHDNSNNESSDNDGMEQQTHVSEIKLLASIDIGSKVLNLQRKMQRKEHRMLWAILKATPYVAALGAISWGSLKLFRKIRGVPNYDFLRTALVDISLLLNVYGDAHPNDMDVRDFGKLVYLVHMLQLEKGRVPKQYRTSFLSEIQLLQTAGLTADQKMKVIDLMYKKYPFLAQQGPLVA